MTDHRADGTTGEQEWLPGLTDPVEIGRGGFGVVYRATETDLNRTVAVKILSGTLDDLALQRFDRERRAMGALSGHPNIVAIYRTGLTPDGRPYLVMEHLTGGTMLDRGPLAWRDAAEVAVRLCAALETAHRAGVLHRDIKPENVFVSSLGAPKLGDFGIARLDGAPQTQSAVITASLAHAAPEIIDGKPPSVQSDMFGLASTVLTLMTGRPPFQRDTDESIVPMLARIATDPVPDLRPHGVPAPLCEVFERAMEKEPGDRFGSVAEFGRAVQEAQRRAGVAVTPLEVQGIDPTVQPGAGAPRLAAPTVDVPMAAPPTVVPPVPPVLPPTVPAPSAPPRAAASGARPAAGAPSPPPSPPAPGPGTPAAYAPAPASAPRRSGGPPKVLVGLAVAGVVLLVVVIAVLALGGGDETAGSGDAPTTTAAVASTSVAPPTTEPPTVTTLEPGADGRNGLEVTEIPFALGDDDALDELAAECSAGELDSCDDLYLESPVDSLFEEFGATCGDRREFAATPCEDDVLAD